MTSSVVRFTRKSLSTGASITFSPRISGSSGHSVGAFVLRHVVRVRDAEPLVEALTRGQERRLIAEMPFSKNAGRIARGLQHLGDGRLVWMESLARDGLEHDGTAVAHMHVEASRVAASHERRAAWRADTAGDIEAREARAFRREAIDVRRAVRCRGIEAAQVPVPEVVHEDEDDVRFRRRGGMQREQRGEECHGHGAEESTSQRRDGSGGAACVHTNSVHGEGRSGSEPATFSRKRP